MLKLLRFWWRFEGVVTRRDYFLHGAALTAIKFAGDVALVSIATGHAWTLANYVRPFTAIAFGNGPVPDWFLPALGLWTLPFLWIGITLTVRRLADAVAPVPLVLLFVVPWINYVLMLALCVLPSRSKPAAVSVVAESSISRTAAYASAIASGAALGAVMMGFSVFGLNSYSAGLFLGAPFLSCTFTGWVLVRLRPAATAANAMVAALLMLLVVGLGLLAFAQEGLGCLVMASPLAAGIGCFGGVLGHHLGGGGQSRPRTAWLGAIAVPAVLLAAPLQPVALNTHEVLSAVDIDAPPELVWPRVIAFSPIAPPSELMFRSGIAYPIRARIDGSGVGAIRYCEFSTGAFVEPITVWDTNRRLAFDVSSSPAPMREFSPYGGVAPPHLKGFLNSRRGEFRLVDLGGGRTRLEGRTWYTIDMGPEAYWQLFSDRIIHGIHLRVLDHIKREAESARR
jgi:uncharacterized membrane protein YhaH (DUF805 family)